MKKILLYIILLLLILVAACKPSETLPREVRLATIVAKTLTAIPTFTSVPSLTETPTPATSNIPIGTNTTAATVNGPVFVRTVVQNVNLRTNPGMLFQVSRVMPEGTRLQVLGLSPGQEWVSVLNDEGINGWVGIHVIEDFPTGQFPTVEPTDVQRITGRVLDENGQPISGIGYAIVQQNTSKTLRTDAVTDVTGMFYAYLPQSVSGVWTVSYLSISCTSNTMDTACNCVGGRCGMPDPLTTDIDLPRSPDKILQFTWK